MVDLHTHILPSFDDGAKSVEEALEMIRVEYSSYIETIVLTPHYYVTEKDFYDYLNERESAYENLLKYIDNPKIRIILGSEVYYSSFLLKMTNLTELCIRDTDYMLLELPFTRRIEREVIDNIERLITKFNIIPIIAHIERYPGILRDIKILDELKNMNCLFQVNSSSILDMKQARFINKLLENNYIDVLASDCHNLEERAPNLENAVRCIYDAYGADYIGNIIKRAYRIVNNETNTDDGYVL